MAEPDRYELAWQLAMVRGSQRTPAPWDWRRLVLVSALVTAVLWLVTRSR